MTADIDEAEGNDNYTYLKTSSLSNGVGQSTVRSDAEERMAEERLAWKHKNVPAWPKNITFLWNFGPLPSAMYVIRTW